MAFPPLIEQIFNTALTPFKIKKELIPEADPVPEEYLVSLHFNTDISNSLNAFIPAGVKKLSVVSNQTDGTAVVLSMALTYATTTSMTISTSEENDISAYTEKAVTFTVSITGGKKADYLVKLLESE